MKNEKRGSQKISKYEFHCHRLHCQRLPVRLGKRQNSLGSSDQVLLLRVFFLLWTRSWFGDFIPSGRAFFTLLSDATNSPSTSHRLFLFFTGPNKQQQEILITNRICCVGRLVKTHALWWVVVRVEEKGAWKGGIHPSRVSPYQV